MNGMNRLIIIPCALLVAALVTACAHSPAPVEPGAQVRASCPPLSPLPTRLDPDAASLHIAEVRGWYQLCREARLHVPPAVDPQGFTGWQAVNGWGVR